MNPEGALGLPGVIHDGYNELIEVFKSDNLEGFIALKSENEWIFSMTLPIDRNLEHPILYKQTDLMRAACFYRAYRIYSYILTLVPPSPSTSIDEAFKGSRMTPSIMTYALAGNLPINIDLVRDLLARRATTEGCLATAIQTGCIEIIMEIFQDLQEAHPEVPPADLLFLACGRESPLTRAIKSRNVIVVEWILSITDRELDFVRQDEYSGKTSLHIAVKYPNYAMLERFLDYFFTQKPELVNQRYTKNGETALIAFTRKVDFSQPMDWDAIIDLIFRFDWSESVNAKDKFGKTVLHYAIERSLERLVDPLLTIPTLNCNIRDSSKYSPVHIAVRNCSLMLLDKFVSSGKYMLEFDKDDIGRSPLHTACKQGWKDGVQYLIEKAPYLAKEKDASMNVPVVLAAIYGQEEAFSLFVNSEDPDIFTSLGAVNDLSRWTVLHYLAHAKQPVLLKVLLEAWAIRRELWETVDIPAAEEHITPLFLACKSGVVNSVKILLAYGASTANMEEITKVAKTAQIVDILRSARERGVNFLQEIYGFDTLEALVGHYRSSRQ